jgi:hypothetical protein
MPGVPAAGGLPWVRRAVAVLVVGGLLWVGAAAPAAPEAGLTPDWGGGTLTVRGEGFRARERVTLVATVGPERQTFTVDADGAGRFTLRTGLRVPAGGGVALDARGDQATAMAATTSGPTLPLGPGEAAADETSEPARLLRGPGASVALVLAVTALAALGFLGWRARAPRAG